MNNTFKWMNIYQVNILKYYTVGIFVLSILTCIQHEY